jgi:phosphopantetheine adenylyltransferase
MWQKKKKKNVKCLLRVLRRLQDIQVEEQCAPKRNILKENIKPRDIYRII